MQRLIVSLVSASILVSCGFANYQTAKTVSKGDYKIGLGVMYQGNTERELELLSFTPQADIRIGLHERVDLGIALFYAAGALVDAKVNVMPEEHPFALAFSGGLGGGVDAVNPTTGIVHIPLKILASYDLGKGFSPYLGFTHGMWWILNRSKPDELKPDEGETVAGWQGYGDGTIKITVGLEWKFIEKVALYLEYDYQHPVYDDPGDYYSFIPTHFAGFGFRF